MSGCEKMTAEKIYSIDDCNNASIKYNWNRQINRNGGRSGVRTENNNALLKMPPCFLFALQSVNVELNSDRKIKQWICEKIGLVWNESYMHYSDKPYMVEVPKADVTPSPSSLNGLSTVLISAVTGWINAKQTEEAIINAFVGAGFDIDQIKMVLAVKMAKPVAPVAPIAPSIENII